MKTDKYFEFWMAGFADGEACFSAYKKKDRGDVSVDFRIKLRSDDEEILHKIRAYIGYGKIRSYNRNDEDRGGNPYTVYSVCCIAGLRRIVDIFDRAPLMAKKSKDYEIWRQLVMEKSIPSSERDINRMLSLVGSLGDVKRYNSPRLDSVI